MPTKRTVKAQKLKHDAVAAIIGVHLQGIRQKTGITPYEASKKSGLDVNHGYSIESGVRTPALLTFIKYVRGIGADPGTVCSEIERELESGGWLEELP